MIAVPIALVPLEPRDDHERTLRADHPDDVSQHVLGAPLVQGLVQALRESIVDHGREVLAIQTVVAVGGQQLLRPENAHGIEQFVPEDVCP